jgi:hypothetical protein
MNQFLLSVNYHFNQLGYIINEVLYQRLMNQTIKFYSYH